MHEFEATLALRNEVHPQLQTTFQWVDQNSQNTFIQSGKNTHKHWMWKKKCHEVTGVPQFDIYVASLMCGQRLSKKVASTSVFIGNPARRGISSWRGHVLSCKEDTTNSITDVVRNHSFATYFMFSPICTFVGCDALILSFQLPILYINLEYIIMHTRTPLTSPAQEDIIKLFWHISWLKN